MSASPIRDSAGKLCITPGVWSVDTNAFGQASIWNGENIAVALTFHSQTQTDAALIAEAGTVTNQTNRTPAELLRERDEWEEEATRLHGENERLVALVRELRETLCMCFAAWNHNAPMNGDQLHSVLAKSEGV
jgi:hypothetical protein